MLFRVKTNSGITPQIAIAHEGRNVQNPFRVQNPPAREVVVVTIAQLRDRLTYRTSLSKRTLTKTPSCSGIETVDSSSQTVNNCHADGKDPDLGTSPGT